VPPWPKALLAARYVFVNKLEICPKNQPFHRTTRLAFTLTPHLQPINHRGCFSPRGDI
jgi:hypothetical protein